MMTHHDEIRAREQAATPGPWHWDQFHMYLWGPAGEMIADTNGLDGALRIRGAGAKLPMEANAAFLENARSDIPWLLARVATLSGLLRDFVNHTEDMGSFDVNCPKCKGLRARIDVALGEWK